MIISLALNPIIFRAPGASLTWKTPLLHHSYGREKKVCTALFCAAVCWGGSLTVKNTKRLDKMVKKAGLSAGRETGPTKICGGEGHTKQTESYHGE